MSSPRRKHQHPRQKFILACSLFLHQFLLCPGVVYDTPVHNILLLLHTVYRAAARDTTTNNEQRTYTGRPVVGCTGGHYSPNFYFRRSFAFAEMTYKRNIASCLPIKPQSFLRAATEALRRTASIAATFEAHSQMEHGIFL